MPDQVALGVGEPAGLDEEPARQAQLADVMEQRAELDVDQLVAVEPEPARHGVAMAATCSECE